MYYGELCILSASCSLTHITFDIPYKVVTDKFSDVMWAMEQIAKYIGSTREVVSRMLKYFVAEGLVTLQRGEIILKDIPGLKKLAL